MEYLQIISYVITMVFVLIFLVARKSVMNELKRRFFTGKGFAFVSVVGVDKRLQTAFVNMKEDFLKIGNRVFVKREAKSVLIASGEFVESPAKLVPFIVKDGVATPTDKEIALLEKETGKKVVRVNEEGYVLQTNNEIYSGKYPWFFYRYDNPEPVDFFEEKREVTLQCSSCQAQLVTAVQLPKPVDSGYLNTIIQKAKMLGSLAGLGGDKRTQILILIAVAATAISAWYGMQNNTALQQIIKQGVRLPG